MDDNQSKKAIVVLGVILAASVLCNLYLSIASRVEGIKHQEEIKALKKLIERANERL